VVDSPDGLFRLGAVEAHIQQINTRINHIEEKIDTLIQCEADRKADDKALRRYAQFGFWGLVSLGGFVNWEKIVQVFSQVSQK
jgi:hypothetical protein